MHLKIMLAAALAAAGFAFASAQTPEELYDKAMKNNDAIQRPYINGVPHTDARGNVMMKYVKGKSLFPIAFWGVPPHTPGGPYDWKYLKELHLNTVWMYQAFGPKAKYMEDAQKFGLNMIFMGGRTDEELKSVKDYPNFLGNVYTDEPVGHAMDDAKSNEIDKNFKDYAARVKAIAPEAAVFINDASWIMPPATKWFVHWTTCGKIACLDNYVIRTSAANSQSLTDPMPGIPQTLSLSRFANKEQKPLWIILGTFEENYPNGGDNSGFRYCTPEQLRAQVYTSIIHGATGIHYFIWDSFISREASCFGIAPEAQEYAVGLDGKVMSDPKRPNAYRPATSSQQVWARALWDATGRVNKELEELTPALLSPTANPKDIDYAMTAVKFIRGAQITQNPVRSILKTTPEGKEYILITSNVDAGAYIMNYRFDRKIESLELLFNSYPYPVNVAEDGASFELRYDPFGTHIFRLKFTDEKVSLADPVLAAKEIPFDFKKARLWPGQGLDASWITNPINGQKIIHQPCIAGKSNWSVQWGSGNLPKAAPDAEYELQVQIQATLTGKTGKVCGIGLWNGKGNIVYKDVMTSDLNSAVFKWVTIGTVKWDKTAAESSLYIAPNAAAPVEAYDIGAIRLIRK